jgi:hypothetical protein
VGFSGYSLTLQSAPAATPSTPGAFVTYAGTTATGSNPVTATGIATFTNGTVATPWLRVTLSGLTGSGTVYGVLQGSQTLVSKGGSGGGSLAVQVNGTPISSAATTLNFQQGASVTQTGAGTSTVTVTTNANGGLYLGEWVDPITSYNASGSATTTTGSVNTGTPTALTLGSGTGWSSGMGIQVIGAGVAGANLITSCSTVSGTACTLATGASTTVSGAVVKHDDTAAIQAAYTAATLVHLRAGTYNVSSAITIANPGQIVGDGQGQTFIQITAASIATGAFVINTNISGSTTGPDNLGETLRDFTVNQDPTVTPTAGFAFYVTTGGGGGTYVTTLHLVDITINNTFSGVFFGSGAIQNWVERLHIRYLQNGGASGQSGIVVNSPSPSGDTHWDHNELNGPNSGLLIINADTQSFTDMKIVNTGLVINAASNLSVRRIRFDDAAIEGTNGSGVPSCEVNIGANGNTTDQISFTGGGIGLSPNGICATNTLALNVAGVFFYNTTLQITAAGSYGSVIGNTFSSEPSSSTATAVNLTSSSIFSVTSNVIESGAFGVVTDSSIANIYNLNSNVNKNAVANNLNAATVDHEIFTPPSCAADGSHALTFPSGAFSCTAISGGSSGTAGSQLFSTTGSTTATAATATSLIGTVSGSTTIPANTFTAGQYFQFVAQGYFTTPATPASLTIDLKIGGTVRISTGAVVQIASVTSGTWRLSCGVTTRTAGASGTQIANCIFEGTGATLTPGEAPMQTSSAWTIDTTATEAIDLAATWSTTVGAPTITSTNVVGYIPGAASSSGTGVMLASFFTTNSETTTSGSPVDLSTPDTITFTLAATTNVVITYMAYSVLTNNTPAGLLNELNIDGSVTAASVFECDSGNSTFKFMCGLAYKVSLGAGSHTIKVQHWISSGSTGTWTNRLTQAFSSP